METKTRVPIWLIEEEVGGGLPTERTYSHSSSGPPIGHAILPVGMFVKTHIPKATLVRLALAEWAERHGHPAPPEL